MSRSDFILASLTVALAAPTAFGQAPTDWIDPATGHRVIRLSADTGGSSLYFHQNQYTPKGDKLIFDTRAGIAIIDLKKLGKESVKPEVVVPDARAIGTAWRTPDVGRSLIKSPRFNLEIALMADGVAPGDLYKDGKLDVDRAFRKLDEIKPHVKEWWTGALQPARLLAGGEIVMAAARGEKLFIAAHVENPAVGYTWTQAVMGVDYWAVPRAARNPDQAMRFIAYANLSHRQATFATILPLGPVNPRAFGHIESGVGRRLNTHPQNLSRQVFLDQYWWAEHEEEVTRQFERWLRQ